MSRNGEKPLHCGLLIPTTSPACRNRPWRRFHRFFFGPRIPERRHHNDGTGRDAVSQSMHIIEAPEGIFRSVTIRSGAARIPRLQPSTPLLASRN